jgi:hypothetical protein
MMLYKGFGVGGLRWLLQWLCGDDDAYWARRSRLAAEEAAAEAKKPKVILLPASSLDRRYGS